MRRDALERAKKAIRLMEEGVSITEASKRAGTSYYTVRRALELLKHPLGTKVRRTRKGRKRVVVDSYKIDKAECVARKMQYEGMTATDATRACHTTIRTVRDVRLDGCKLLHKWRRRYYLQAFEINTYGVVFYGRLRNAGSPKAITYTEPLKEPGKVNRANLREDNYASIMWQYDFEEFRSLLGPADLCDYYMERILDFLRGELVDKRVTKTITGWLARFGQSSLTSLVDSGLISDAEADAIASGSRPYAMSVLEEVFKLGVVLDDELRCGVDDRDKDVEWVCKSDLRKDGSVVDDGHFQVLVLRKTTSAKYPARPRLVPFVHSLWDELNWKIGRW